MKVKKHIGQTINGFKILDTYIKNLPSGAITRKVLIECADCGRIFERNAGADFKSIKCKCKVKYLMPKKKRDKEIEWEGKIYNKTEFSRKFDIPVETLNYRLTTGMPIEEAIRKTFLCKCVICDKEFEYNRPGKKYCCKTCQNRGNHGRGKYKETLIAECIICGAKFETMRDDAKTCSIECRRKCDRYMRHKRYRNLSKEGHVDPSITLEAVFEKFKGKCAFCEKELSFDLDWNSNDYPSIDHIIPLSRGGFHEWNNVQLLCRGCNTRKGAKLIAI